MPRDTSPVHGNIFLAPGIDSQLAHQLLDTPARRVIAEGRRGRLEEVCHDGTSYARKVYRVTKKSIHGTAVSWMPAFMRWGRVRRSWKAMLEGKKRAMPLPRVLCRSENRRQARLVTTWIPGEPLHHWHARQLQQSDDDSWQRSFAEWIGPQLYQLFDAGMTTRDLSPNNVLITGPTAGPWQFHLVDLDEARLQRFTDGESFIDQVIYSLSQVGHLPSTISPRVKLRALIAFLEAGGQRWADGQAEFSPRSTSFFDRRAARKKFMRQVIDGVLRFDRRKEKQLKKAGRTGRYAGWGLDDDGLPVPFDGARDET